MQDTAESTETQWLREVELETEPFRDRQRAKYLKKAEKASIEAGLMSLRAEETAEILRTLLPRELWNTIPDWVARAEAQKVIAAGGKVDLKFQRVEARAWLTRARWNMGRAKGQQTRFDDLDACSTTEATVLCISCSREPITFKVGCGIRRLCKACADRATDKRKVRIGTSRGSWILESGMRGHRNPWRKGGAYSEKMVTLTVPHIGENLDDAVVGRVVLLFEAWKVFSKRLSAWVRQLRKKNKTEIIHWYRAFEWTEGDDYPKWGHPHFHLYLWSPYFPREVFASWWCEAIDGVRRHHFNHYDRADRRTQNRCVAVAREVCVFTKRGPKCEAVPTRSPFEGRCAYLNDASARKKIGQKKSRVCRAQKIPKEHAVYIGVGPRRKPDLPRDSAGSPLMASERAFDVRAFETESPALLREMLKSGRKGAIRLSGLTPKGAEGAGLVLDYAEGWTMADVRNKVNPQVAARLYEALEGRRLAQGSRGFLSRAPIVCACGMCGAPRALRITFKNHTQIEGDKSDATRAKADEVNALLEKLTRAPP